MQKRLNENKLSRNIYRLPIVEINYSKILHCNYK